MPRTGTRPTTDRVRESLFNLLTARLDLGGVSVLDLYAGSGALGLEALSRGAASAVFVESDQRAAGMIDQNIAALGVTGATVRRGPRDGGAGAGAQRPVDLVLADPPYDVAAAGIEAVLDVLTRGMDGARHGRRRRTRDVGPVADLAGRLAGVAVAHLRRHPP